jgi:hypothetical protein
MNLKMLLVILGMATLLSNISCLNNDNKQKSNTPVTTNRHPIETHENESVFNSLDKTEILKRIFDNPEFDSGGTAIWKPNYYERMNMTVSYDGKCHTSVDTTMYFIDRQKRKCAVIILTTYNYERDYLDSTKIEISDCHFCGVPIGIVLLSQTEDKKWNLYKFEKAFTPLGYFGIYKSGRQDSGKICLKEIGDKWTCLSLTQGIGGNGGIDEGSETLYSIEEFQLGGFPNTSLLQNILSYEFYYSDVDDEGVDDKRPESEIRNERTQMKIIKKKGTYYDIDLITTAKHKPTKEHYYKYSEDNNGYIER